MGFDCLKAAVSTVKQQVSLFCTGDKSGPGHGLEVSEVQPSVGYISRLVYNTIMLKKSDLV